MFLILKKKKKKKKPSKKKCNLISIFKKKKKKKKKKKRVFATIVMITQLPKNHLWLLLQSKCENKLILIFFFMCKKRNENLKAE